MPSKKKQTQKKANNGLPNKINVSLNPNDVKDAVQEIKKLAAKFPFLISIAQPDKITMPGIDVNNKQWVEDAINEMIDDASILPPYMANAITLATTDLKLFADLEKIILPLKNLLAQLEDTQFLAGSEAYKVALIYYNLLPAAIKAGVPNAEEKYFRLKKRFTVQSTKTTPTDTTKA